MQIFRGIAVKYSRNSARSLTQIDREKVTRKSRVSKESLRYLVYELASVTCRLPNPLQTLL